VYLYTQSWPIAVRQDVALNILTLQMRTEMDSVHLHGSQQAFRSDRNNDELQLLEANFCLFVSI